MPLRMVVIVTDAPIRDARLARGSEGSGILELSGWIFQLRQESRLHAYAL